MEIARPEMLHGLYGSMIKRTRAVGYCRCHDCHLTVATLKQHECLRKQCNALKKHEDNDYWRQRDQKKAMKKANKLNGGTH